MDTGHTPNIKGWSVSSGWKLVKPRQTHHCVWCDRTWPKGAPIWTWGGISNGRPARVYICVVCLSYARKYKLEANNLGRTPFWKSAPRKYREVEAKFCMELTVAKVRPVVEILGAEGYPPEQFMMLTRSEE